MSNGKTTTIWNKPDLEFLELAGKPDQKTGTQYSEQLEITSQRLKERSKHNIYFSDPLISLNNNPFIFHRTINFIQGKSGVHKSRLAEHIASVLLSKDIQSNILGFNLETEEKIDLAYIDTERNLDEEFPFALQSIRLNAGYYKTEDPPGFNYTSLLSLARQNRSDALKGYLNQLRLKSDNHLFIIFDVISDCTKNFNDPRESLEFLDFLAKLINDFNITILGVIHENPGKNETKARGHLGTEITNKATTILSLDYFKDSSEILEVKIVKCRRTKKYTSFKVKYDESRGQLVLPEECEIPTSRSVKADVQKVSAFLIEILPDNPCERKKLLSFIVDRFDCSERTAQDRLDNILENNLLRRDGYELVYESVADNQRNKKQYRIVNLSSSTSE